VVDRVSVQISTWERLVRLRKQRRVQNIATVLLFVLGPVLALTTFLVFGIFDQGAQSAILRLTLLGDLVYVLVIAALVLARVARMIVARRQKSAGSRLHLRLTGVFALLALIPTVLVAVFAVLTVNVGLEGWFSDRVSGVLGTSLEAAQAYENEHRDGLVEDAEALAGFLNQSRQTARILPDSALRQILAQGQTRIQRGLREAYVINSDAEIRVRGDRSYRFDYERPDPDQMQRARDGETVVIEDWNLNEFRALVYLNDFSDHYLYISRDVDGKILNLLDNTKETVIFYNQLESQRGQLLFEFGLIYLGFAVILILAAIWLGMWFAERLSGPVGRLAGAAQRVGAGDLDVRVREEDGEDEIAMLGRLFNQMTRQLKGQRERLLENTDQIERRRRVFDSVLSSVTAGVVGLDGDGCVMFLNRAARGLLDVTDENGLGGELKLLIPEFYPLFKTLRDGRRENVQEELRLTRLGKQESLLVRMATRRNDENGLEGYVITFDDVTELVSAQRMAAWGDVARRIAHEIKNPLTPIQLSAERIKRKFRKHAGDDAEALDQYTDVIIRQTNDLRRIVDEFSKFARMPEPERRLNDLTKILSDAVLLQDAGQEGVRINAELPDQPVMAEIDATMISQALTNLIKNAGEAIETLQEKGAPDGFEPEIRVEMHDLGDEVHITIADNGIGLPVDRARLFEPYVTTRAKGTGLGLPIVKKIIEEHGGTLALKNAVPFGAGAHCGAMADILLPIEKT